MAPGDAENWVLYIDPDEEMHERVRTAFSRTDIRIEAVRDAETAQRVLANSRPSCIVSEYELPDGTGLELLEQVPDTIPLVLFTDSGSERVASEAVSAGVAEYILKRPLEEQLSRLVDRVADLFDTRVRGGVDETLKDRAMDRAPVGITVADMRLSDEPLIYVNDAFERLTGYTVEETLGRNCRFLQGEDSDEEAIATMRAAIENDESTAVELKNYTKSGEGFWNRVEIAPIQSANGETTHYVGYQTDVSARKETEITARERADALERKQEEFESVLARIEGLLRDASVGVIHARTPDDIEKQVCESLVGADGYRLAWMGDRSRNDEEIEPDCWATADDEEPGEIEPATELVETALREDVVAFDGSQPDVPGDESDLPAVEAEMSPTVEEVSTWLGTDESSTRAVVPVTYRDTTYGVVGIHADGTHEFDRHEAIVLSTFGRIVGTATNTVRTQSLLQGDAAIELELAIGAGESFVGLTSRTDCALGHVGTVPPGEDPTMKLFFEVQDDAPETVVSVAEAHDDIEDATVVRAAENRDSGLVRLSIGNSPLIDALVEFGGTITDASAVNGSGRVTVQLSKDADPRTFVDEFESRVPGATLKSYQDDKRPQRTNQEFVAEVNSLLTDRQRDALQTAYASGFFRWPRQASGDEVADVMGITRATFHQHLRAAERKLLDAFYG